MFQIEFCSTFQEVDSVVRQVKEYLLQCNCPELEPIIFFVLFAVRELLNNAVEHGNSLDYQKKVCVALDLNGAGFQIRVSDEGTGIRWGQVIVPEDGQLSERSRGLRTLLDMGFRIHNQGATIIADLPTDAMQQLAKR